MGARDLTEFRVAGKTLFSLGLVKAAEGNLSVFDGGRLLITRTGCRLAQLASGDVLEGTLESPPQDASSDVALHVGLFREKGPGAVAHAHPPGTVPIGWVEGEPHGIYAHAATLELATEQIVTGVRAGADRAGERPITPIAWAGNAVRILDQTRLPEQEVFLECRTPSEVADAIRRLAIRGAPILGVAAAACAAMGRFGSELVPQGANVLTHCNTGMLCTAGIGTAMGVIYTAHLEGKGVHAWVDETRPVWQGARLTAWELQRLGVPMTLIPDAAAGSLMAAGRVDLVMVGADRIAANGDVANKIGTYQLAVLAHHHGVPFHVVAPTPTIDLATGTGEGIPIEERDPGEVTAPLGLTVAPRGTPAANPAFDVTPAELVTSIVTERGIARRPLGSGLDALLRGAA